MPYYSYIMLCYNNWKLTKNAIDSFFENINPIHQSKGIEFIIINNGSSDETSAELEKYVSKFGNTAEIITFNTNKNLGYIMGINTGLSKCTGKFITILNNDLIFCPNWFDGIADIFERDCTVGAAVPLMTNGSGPENIVLEFKTPEIKTAFFNSKETMHHHAKSFMTNNKNVVIPCNRLVGACITFRRELLTLIGGLDFWLGIGIFDDDDFSMRINIAGYKTVIVGRSFVYHVGSATFDHEKPVNRAAVIANKNKFLRKWKIKCTENPEGIYSTRDEVIWFLPYRRKSHFFPVTDDEFSQDSKLLSNESCKVKRILFAADWTNFLSKWPEKLESVLLQEASNVQI